ncbi:hypothetical protein [Streptococcus loxodontisalivarius]|uniref:Uncharacterized protein YndB with AHSA1/START domain n=1 Tax=Streptococcus loxodontisalivarius TaxID=1349415 RepID=A0ABS2PW47_9STRE|nr:hypothetical protein [Streptococcus loxodontisalivarius]MBM7643684.1 uncharacterized protein YndB with AHSA1/START domain [Streptococcus loxodontisalivarius]
MDIRLTQSSGNWQLDAVKILSASKEQIWDLLTTSQGLASWFPQLSWTDQGWLFTMPERELVFSAIEKRDQEFLQIAWDQAVLTFELLENGLRFKEVIPCDYQSDYSDAKKDMAGWLTQLEVIASLLSGQSMDSVADRVAYWETYLSKMM